jgi:glycosyltransferase involved in cell wall biosynthesis
VRILVPVLGLPAGRAGSEDYHRQILSGLARRGHAVTAFGPATGSAAFGRDVEWLPHPPQRLANVVWRVSDLVWLRQMTRHVARIAARRWDVVISGLLPPLWALQRRWPSLPTVYVPHSMLAGRELLTYASPAVPRYVGAFTYGRLQRWAWRHATAVVSSTDAGAAIRSRHYGGRPLRLYVSPFGVDADRFQPRPRDAALLDALAIPREAPLVVWAGRLAPLKDLPLLLRAFAALRHSPHPHLLVVGDGPRAELDRLVSDLGIADRVRFAGFQPTLERYLALADVYVSTSRLESFGLTVIQALACGVPALVRRGRYPDVLTGSPELVREGVTGFAFESEVELTSRLERVLGDARLRETMATAARISAVSDFSWERHLTDLERVIDDVCNVHVVAHSKT